MAESRSHLAPNPAFERDFASTRIRLTYADCDPAGIVYFASWFPWMERLLSGWLFDQGLRSDQLMENHGFATITRQAECEYLHPAALFDEIRMDMVSARIGRTSVHWGFTMRRERDGVEVGRGKITWVTIDGQGLPLRVPEQIRAAVASARPPQEG